MEPEPVLVWLILALMLLSVGGMVVYLNYNDRNRRTEWHPHDPMFSPIPGEKIVMRRWHNGKWEYRKITPEEEAEYMSQTVW